MRIINAATGAPVQLSVSAGEPAPVTVEEYLRRNLLHAASVGAHAGAEASLKRLKGMRRAPKWLLDSLAGVVERADRVSQEMARHRAEIVVTHG